ncbi:hypothetical protein ACKKBG_A01205 [Auxenochlorella protothecoides x Auxenochlorella symbiontica]
MAASHIFGSSLMDLIEAGGDGPIEIDTTLLYSAMPSRENSTASSPTRQPPSRRGSQISPEALNADQLDSQLKHTLLRPERGLAGDDYHESQGTAGACKTRKSLWQERQQSWTSRQPPIEDRVRLQARRRELRLASLREELEREALGECTFAPKLVADSAHVLGPDYPSLTTRNAALHRKRACMQEEAAGPFKPELNPRSLMLAEAAAARKLEGGLDDRKDTQTQQHSPVCTFEPKLYLASQRLLETSATVPAYFPERQKYFELKKQERLQQLQADESLTFVPHTRPLPGAAERPAETPAERALRMAVKEPAEAAARRAAARQEAAAALSFQPAINARSRRIGRESGVDVLLTRPAVPASARSAQDDSAPPTRPMQHKPLRHRRRGSPGAADAGSTAPSHLPLPERALQKAAEREALLAAKRAEIDAARLAECTFSPALVGGPRRPAALAAAPPPRGLGRHLELQRLAAKRRAEAEERAAQVFRLAPRAPAHPFTIPQPFRLEGLARQARRRAEGEESHQLA